MFSRRPCAGTLAAKDGARQVARVPLRPCQVRLVHRRAVVALAVVHGEQQVAVRFGEIRLQLDRTAQACLRFVAADSI